MVGRKRKPTKLHLVHGTAQKCRINKNEPKPPDDLPRSAAELDSRESYWYGIVVSRIQLLGVASSVDSERVMMLAQDLAMLELHNQDIRERGRIYAKIDLVKLPPTKEHPAGEVKAQKTWKANPAVGQRSDCIRRINSMLSEFGISPASRPKVSASGKDAEQKTGWEALV